MLPKKLKLKNFCQYASFEFEYQTGVTGIIGNNGVGKTNLLDEAQYFAFTGESAKNKADLLKWGETSGHTELEFLHAGKAYTLTRSLQNSTVKLVDSTGGVWKNAQANAEMETILGMSPMMFHETCFVSQGNLWEILTMSHAKRMEYFQKLSDAVRAERLRGIVQEKLVLLPTYPDRTEELKREQAGLEALTAAHPSLVEKAAKLTELKRGFDERMPAIHALLDLPLAETRDTAVANKTKTLEVLQSERVEFQKANPVPAAVEVVNITAAEQQKAARGQQYLVAVQARDQLRKEITELGLQIDQELGGAPEPGRLLKESQGVRDEITRLEREYKLLTMGKCPNCGQAYKSEQTPEAVATLLNTQKVKLGELNVAYTKHESNAAKLSSAGAVLERQEKTVLTLDDAKYFEPVAWQLRLQAAEAYSQFLQKRDKLRQRLGDFDMRQTKLELELKQLREQRVVTAEDRQKAAEFQDNYQQLEQDLRLVSGELTTNETSSKFLTENIKRIEAEKVTQVKVEELRSLFDRGREHLHREHLPKLVMMTLLQVLNERLISFLALFDLPFTVVIDDNFDFQAYFPGVGAKPAGSCLSGGQKVATSIAFRMAQAEVLAGSLPLMVLDEPTNHLDASNKEQIRDVLIKIRRIAEKGTSILVASHDPVLIPAYNRVVDLAAKK